MSHFEERLQSDLEAIRAGIREVSDAIGVALKDAVHSLVVGDRALAAETILGDLPINRAVRELDRKCHAFVALHLPSAGHLRFVSSVLRLNVALERIGDYAVTICREMVQLSAPPPDHLLRDVDLIGDQVRKVYAQAMTAFLDGNAEMARGTIPMADQIETTFVKVFEDLLAEGEREGGTVRDLFALLVVINRLGRVGDQSKNICEETLFAVTGETKAPKVYRVLFVDSANSSYSRVAERYAAKAFPESGRFASAGWAPAAKNDARVDLFLKSHGLALDEAEPVALTDKVDEVAEYHVIVALEPGVREHLDPVPFHTVLVEWEVGPALEGLDSERFDAALGSAFGEIRGRTQRLMETLRGEGAA